MQTNITFDSGMRVVNKKLYVKNTETVVIDAPILGYQNFGLSITNFNGSPVLSVNIYASADGTNFYSVEADALNNIDPDLTQQYAFNLVNKFIRVTAVSVGTSIIDCYLIGEV